MAISQPICLLGGFGYFPYLTYYHNEALNILVHVFRVDISFSWACLKVWYFQVIECVHIELRRYYQAVFQNVCSNLHAHQQCVRVALLHILTNAWYFPSFSFLLFWWYPIVVLILIYLF